MIDIDPEIELAYAPTTSADSPDFVPTIRAALDAEYAAHRPTRAATQACIHCSVHIEWIDHPIPGWYHCPPGTDRHRSHSGRSPYRECKVRTVAEVSK